MSYGNVTNGVSYSTGTIFLNPQAGEYPKPASKELLSTRAVQTKEGWLGQIIMSGEIVYESKAFEDSEDALEHVSEHIHKKFKKLIVGTG
jgi:hypothetical protein